jgi:hypothetical protein
MIPFDRLFVRHQLRLAGGNIAHELQSVGVIGDHQPIQRARQPYCLPGGRYHFLAAREPIGLDRRQVVAF